MSSPLFIQLLSIPDLVSSPFSPNVVVRATNDTVFFRTETKYLEGYRHDFTILSYFFRRNGGDHSGCCWKCVSYAIAYRLGGVNTLSSSHSNSALTPKVRLAKRRHPRLPKPPAPVQRRILKGWGPMFALCSCLLFVLSSHTCRAVCHAHRRHLGGAPQVVYLGNPVAVPYLFRNFFSISGMELRGREITWRHENPSNGWSKFIPIQDPS